MFSAFGLTRSVVVVAYADITYNRGTLNCIFSLMYLYLSFLLCVYIELSFVQREDSRLCMEIWLGSPENYTHANNVARNI